MNFKETMKEFLKKIFFPNQFTKKFSLTLTQGLAARLFYFQRMMDRVAAVPGDVVECGVGKAKSFQMLAMLIGYYKRPGNLWGFDSFGGYPEPTIEDRSPRNRIKGEWNFLSHHKVKDVLYQAGIKDDFLQRVKLVKGFVEQFQKIR